MFERYFILTFIMFAIYAAVQMDEHAFAHGFNANHVKIVKLSNHYRVIIRYTHVEVGEYRQAQIDFKDKKAAIKFYNDLQHGADFFLGTQAAAHFHSEAVKNSPY